MTYFFVPLRFITMAWAHWGIVDARWLRFAAALTFDVHRQLQLNKLIYNPRSDLHLGDLHGGRRALEHEVQMLARDLGRKRSRHE